MRLSVVIVNYNTKELVLECIESIKKSGFDGGLEVIVVDNASTDKSVQELDKLIKLIKHEKNEGFARSVKDGVVAAKSDLVILLNTDVTPERDLLKYVLPHFKDPDIFAVSFNEGKYGWARREPKSLFGHLGEARRLVKRNGKNLVD